eukprot:CAMPEP_0114989478 /NCGR_PEP_ID=MMETSP0216-20121206/10220_1 /TAXON_ID=223996 /ORGANISM="Protocruzia adherens, Strain Boccale" /LENGTH=272 /DNA_ID=CAMNT_0002352461 /DNA_START=64 /DNA_END=882 /DNA_ORIENTATION=+
MLNNLPFNERKQFFTDTLVTSKNVNDLNKCANNLEIRRLIREMLQLESSPKNEIIIDFHYNNYILTRDLSLSVEKASTFLSIFKFIFEKSLNEKLSDETSFKIFKEQILRHAVQRPPFSCGIFSLDDVKQITDYALRTFYKHYSLYEFSFTSHQDMSLATIHRFEGRFPFLLDLGDGQKIDPAEIPALAEYLKVEESTENVAESTKSRRSGRETDRSMRSQAEDLPSAEDIKIEKLINKEMEALKKQMEEKMKLQDDDFVQKLDGLNSGKKK